LGAAQLSKDRKAAIQQRRQFVASNEYCQPPEKSIRIPHQPPHEPSFHAAGAHNQ
jgi:hypothetical protein